jgi:Uma2 family endonuclease
MEIQTMDLEKLLINSSELGIRLEIMNDLPIWELQPIYRHQKHVKRIANNIKATSEAHSRGCECVAIQDVYIKFLNGLKRPDIAILCHEPPESEQDKALEMIPEAVIEVLSRGFERKDLKEGPPFYLQEGVKEVLVFNPADGKIHYFTTADPAKIYQSPREFALMCGCTVTL